MRALHTEKLTSIGIEGSLVGFLGIRRDFSGYHPQREITQDEFLQETMMEGRTLIGFHQASIGYNWWAVFLFSDAAYGIVFSTVHRGVRAVFRRKRDGRGFIAVKFYRIGCRHPEMGPDSTQCSCGYRR
jgi:hypothetical protein